jgi:hypothetical protein
MPDGGGRTKEMANHPRKQYQEYKNITQLYV